MAELNLVWIDHESSEFRQWIDLRQKILREPLGLKFSREDLEREKEDRHLVAILRDGTIAGGLILQTFDQPEGIAKLRQVAVASRYQGMGIGQTLVRESEKIAGQMKIREITLHSRKSVSGFYEKLSYRTEGDPFLEVGIPHLLMRKKLTGE